MASESCNVSVKKTMIKVKNQLKLEELGMKKVVLTRMLISL